MPSPRYRVTGLPPAAAAGATAFTPHYNRLAASGAQQYKDGLTGQPGTRGIPLLHPPAILQEDVAIALMGTARSSNAPDMHYPNQYYALPEREFYPGAGMPVQVYDPVNPALTTMLPVPAIDTGLALRGRQALLAAGVDNDRNGQITQWRAIVRWAQRRKAQGAGHG